MIQNISNENRKEYEQGRKKLMQPLEKKKRLEEINHNCRRE